MTWNFVLFDMDGTLVDSAEVVISRYKETFEHFGVQIPNQTELHSLVGPSALMSMTKYLGAEEAKNGVSFYRELARRDGLVGLELFPGIKELLSTLSHAGLKMAVATSKPEKEAQKIVSHFGIECYFDFVSGASDIDGIHTKSDVMQRAIAGLNADLDSTIMIGDRVFDVEGSQDCGIPCIFVTWGGADLVEAEEAHTTVTRTEELLKLLMDGQ